MSLFVSEVHDTQREIRDDGKREKSFCYGTIDTYCTTQSDRSESVVNVSVSHTHTHKRAVAPSLSQRASDGRTAMTSEEIILCGRPKIFERKENDVRKGTFGIAPSPTHKPFPPRAPFSPFRPRKKGGVGRRREAHQRHVIFFQKERSIFPSPLLSRLRTPMSKFCLQRPPESFCEDARGAERWGREKKTFFSCILGGGLWKLHPLTRLP